MYQRGGDRGWHRGHDNSYHHARDVYPSPALRSPCSRPYRGSHPRHRWVTFMFSTNKPKFWEYQIHFCFCREHGNYGSEGYHDYHDNSFHERNYGDGQYMEYEEPPYPSEDQSYQEYRDSGYSRGGHHDGGYNKGSYYRGGYRGGDRGHYRGKHPDTYQKKYSAKYAKVYSKEHGKSKPSTTKPVPKAVQNRNIVVLVSGDEGESNVPSKTKTGAEETLKPNEDTKTDGKLKDCVVPATEVNQECPEEIAIAPAAEIKTEITEELKEENFPEAEIQKEEALTRTVKKEDSDDGEQSFNNKKREGETSTGKRLCSERIPEMCHNEGEMQIPLLDAWNDVSPPSPVTPSVSDQGGAGSETGREQSETALALRTAFILTKKEELEMAYAQDCRTFAFVADTLLKKNPSIEAAVASALRSSLYDLAGRCVHELTSYIDSYDRESNVIFNTEKKEQDPEG
ncbi:periphilin-1 isoform X2 [Xenopus laevis]|uniref:Periphilin-1 isoform X2 n=1 Tax=Xenopus laevis TaxID=8355 RepID=A0A8J1MEI8_XENLA|nr:periphilin-1 isoform X2 [Xenopus laevis]